MELKEKLELLNEKSSIMEIQKYIKDMKKARKFDGVTIEREMMLFLEELADCFIYLLSIANMSNVDIFKAFKEKEIKNCDRVWK